MCQGVSWALVEFGPMHSPGYGHGGYQEVLFAGEEIVDFLEIVSTGAAAPSVALIGQR